MISNKHIFVLFFLMFFTCPASAETPPDNKNSIETRVELFEQKIATLKEELKMELKVELLNEKISTLTKVELLNEKISTLKNRVDRDVIVVGIFAILVIFGNFLGWSYIKKRIEIVIAGKAYKRMKVMLSEFSKYVDATKIAIRDQIDIDTPRKESNRHLRIIKNNLPKVKEENRYSAHDWFYKGVSEYLNLHLDKAMEYYTEAIKLNPSFIDAYCNRGIIYSDRKEYDNAISDFEKATKIEPGYISAYFNIAEFNILKGDYTSGSDIINKGNSFFNELSLKNKAMLLFFDCTIKAILDMDTSDQDEKLRHILKQDFTITWSFSELEQWLSMPTNVNDETKKYIKNKIAIFRNKTRAE